MHIFRINQTYPIKKQRAKVIPTFNKYAQAILIIKNIVYFEKKI